MYNKDLFMWNILLIFVLGFLIYDVANTTWERIFFFHKPFGACVGMSRRVFYLNQSHVQLRESAIRSCNNLTNFFSGDFSFFFSLFVLFLFSSFFGISLTSLYG